MTRIAFIVALAPAIAAADPTGDVPASGAGETIVIEGHAPDRATARDRERALDEAPFVTVVHPDEHPATASVADAVGQTVGVQTRSLGGLGAYESISVRGAAPGHTEVLVDGIPLARLAEVTTDLGHYSLDAFGRVDLYRGAVPVELGGAGVGGALNLVTLLGPNARGDTVQASAGIGSFGARHVRVHYGGSHADGRVLSSTTLGYSGATGDFTYYDNNGTPLNLNDDSKQTRRNNGFDQVDGASRLGATDGSASGGIRAAYKHQGLAGSVALPSTDASLSTIDAIGDARALHRITDCITERELGYLLVETQRLRDPLGELGLGTQERAYLTLSGGASSAWTAPIAGEKASWGVELRGDHFRDRDVSGVQPSVTGDREAGAAMASVDVAIGRELVVTPAMRLELVHTAPAPTEVGPDAMTPVPSRWDTLPSPRLTARYLVGRDISIKGSGGWYSRLPTLVELFGDRGYILGSPDLRPEHGPTAELGAVWAPAAATGPVDRVLVEVDGFINKPHDTIAFITSSGYVARAENIGDTQSIGAEIVASARLWKVLSATASYTQLDTEQLTADVNYNGKALPREPENTLYARLDVAPRLAGRAIDCWADTSAQSSSFLDKANLGRVPGRVLIGAGLRVELVARIAFAASVSNLADTRVAQLPLQPPPSPTFTSTPTALADVAGFPLPGRSFYASIEWSH